MRAHVTRWKDDRHFQAATRVSIFVSADPPGTAVCILPETIEADETCHSPSGMIHGTDVEHHMSLQPLQTAAIAE